MACLRDIGMMPRARRGDDHQLPLLRTVGDRKAGSLETRRPGRNAKTRLAVAPKAPSFSFTCILRRSLNDFERPSSFERTERSGGNSSATGQEAQGLASEGREGLQCLRPSAADLCRPRLIENASKERVWSGTSDGSRRRVDLTVDTNLAQARPRATRWCGQALAISLLARLSSFARSSLGQYTRVSRRRRPDRKTSHSTRSSTHLAVQQVSLNSFYDFYKAADRPTRQPERRERMRVDGEMVRSREVADALTLCQR